MVATGIVRRVDDLGRLVIPKELRRKFRIKEESPIEIFTEGDAIVLKLYNPMKTYEVTVTKEVTYTIDAESKEEAIATAMEKFSREHTPHISVKEV